MKNAEVTVAQVIPNSKNIQAFATQAAFETWLRKHHATATELWLKIHKKDSGLPTVTYAQALDVALCWGWIDGLKKTFDAQSFLQRFTPRKAKSLWSANNRDHVERLVKAGRMTEHGQAHVDAAKKDGRWDKAYQGAAKMEFPDDLLAAIEAEPRALDLFQKLNATNRYALAFRTHNMKTAAAARKKSWPWWTCSSRAKRLIPTRHDPLMCAAQPAGSSTRHVCPRQCRVS